MAPETTDSRAQALNPETPLEELLTLAEEYPNEVLRNPVFDLLLVEDPGFLARMSGAAQLAILKADACPEFVRSLFSLGELTVYAAENYQDESHFYDYEFEDTRVRLKGTSEGCEWSYLALAPALLPYFMGTLQDEVENGCGKFPGTSAFLSATIHHSSLVDVGDSGKDKRYFFPPEGADEAIVWLDDEEYFIYRDEDDYRWKSGPATERLKEIAADFFPAYDEGDLGYQDEYDDDCRRGWDFHSVQGIRLHCRAGAGSEQDVDISVDDLIELCDRLPPAQPEQIGVLVQTNLGGCANYGVLEEIDLPDGLDEVGDLAELRAALADQEDWEEEVVETFTELGARILDNSSILGVTAPSRVEVLIRTPDEADPSLFVTVPCWGGESFLNGGGEDVRYRMESGKWLPLGTFLEQIQEPGEFRDRLLFTAATNGEIEIDVRMPAGIPYIKGSVGCEFTEAVDLDIELTQCLPLTEDENICILQGYDHGEFETGIMNCGFCQGSYTYTHRSLEGTVWEGLGLEPAKR